MVADVRRLRPGDLARLVNSTAMGAVLTERQLHRHRVRAGFRIGDGTTIDLLRYLGWLADQVHAPKTVVQEDGGYEAHKRAAAERSRLASESGRDIGELPAVVDPARKLAASQSFRSFCESYFPELFNLAWSPDHLKVIAKTEQAVLQGGLFALAMPRGSGKTTLAECACLWAILFGHREFVCLIGSDEAHALEMLDSLKTELESNELILEDFPEAAFPIHCLDGIAHRANGQLYRGERTHIGWTAREIILPTMPGSTASGAIIRVAGITGRIRGMKFKRPDGRAVRPSLVVLDDPQTDESARSLSQCQHRESILAGAVLGLGGPGKKIAGVMPCTVIHPGDMADRILDREQHPQWQGERTRMVYSFPTDTKLWEQYAKHRADGLRAERGLADATAFYAEHRAAMDSGSAVAWPERFNHDEISAIQHAMNLKLQDERAFWSEYQNEPLPEDTADDDDLTAEQILAKLNGLGRSEVPGEVSHLTAFIDVQQKALFWVVCGWADDFTGYVLDYGTWPDQHRRYFTLRDLRITMALATKGAGLEGAIYAGLEQLTNHLLARRWERDDGAELSIDRCLVDANWGQSTDVVYQFCRQSARAGVLLPSHGRFVGASSIPFTDYKRRRGDRVGHHWRIPAVIGKRTVRHVLYDANHWKSFIHTRFAVPMGDPGCLSVWGQDPEGHRLLADHLTSEYRVRTEGRGRVVDEWRLKPNGFDNHWFDGLVGCAVAASIQGVALPELAPVRVAVSARLKLSGMRHSEKSPHRMTSTHEHT
ncbi:MAG: phage terminase large subunit family protein [Planctomycetes bacterium]|nr:phage terminase large subunit family protein [Planctomycetota bacterium]